MNRRSVCYACSGLFLRTSEIGYGVRFCELSEMQIGFPLFVHPALQPRWRALYC